MKKLFRIIVAVITIVLGGGIVFFSINALIQGVDWLTALIYVSFTVIGLGFFAISWAIIRGDDIKEMLRDLFSGISF